MNLKILLNNLLNFNPGGETTIFFVILLISFLLGVFSFLFIYYRPLQKKSLTIESALNNKLTEAQKELSALLNESKNLQDKLKESEDRILTIQYQTKENNSYTEQSQLKTQRLEQDLKLLSSEKNILKEELTSLKILLAEKEKTESDLNEKIASLIHFNNEKELFLHELENKITESETKELNLIQSLESVNNNLEDAILQIEKLNREIEILNAVIQTKEKLLEEKKNTELLADNTTGVINSINLRNSDDETSLQNQSANPRFRSDLKKLSGMTKETEQILNNSGINSIEQLAFVSESDIKKIYASLKNDIHLSKLELWVIEAKKILTKQKIILLTKDINLKKMFRKKS